MYFSISSRAVTLINGGDCSSEPPPRTGFFFLLGEIRERTGWDQPATPSEGSTPPRTKYLLPSSPRLLILGNSIDALIRPRSWSMACGWTDPALLRLFGRAILHDNLSKEEEAEPGEGSKEEGEEAETIPAVEEGARQ
ncbi:hypothetical protein CRG98_000628 [Punica granatum]|uniref:Uncharacterized protein n=1 Tax=Punica granatum TaxID=22663 RepID=A0A2I0LE88_PUNGR|nr:hypothetical protein CRG98_000628 [Punica granatum]